MSTTSTSFGPVGVEEVTELRALGIRIMGSEDLSFPAEVLEAWLGRNPEIIQVVRARDRIAGYAVILPLAAETVDQVMRRALRPRQIPPGAILAYEPGVEGALYVAEMAIDQELAERSIGAAVLVRHWMRFFAAKIELGFRPTGLWCVVGLSRKGTEFSRRLGFTEIHIEGVSDPEWAAMRLSLGDESPLFHKVGPAAPPAGQPARSDS
ncbi:MAG TPA: hypothetical protein VNO33_02595 [Kofleriaceae bacterium]|nr:hypothetical protein [Kofleriaceae bacterium]